MLYVYLEILINFIFNNYYINLSMSENKYQVSDKDLDNFDVHDQSNYDIDNFKIPNNERTSNINVYENDDAYLLEEQNIPNNQNKNNEEENEENNNMYYENQYSHDETNNIEEGQFHNNEDPEENNENTTEFQKNINSKTNNKNMNYYNTNNERHYINDDNNNNIESQEQQNLEFEENNNDNEVIDNNELNDKEQNQEYQYNNEEFNDDIIDQEQDQNNYVQSNLDKSQSQFTSLLKIQYISVCQSCKESFNSTINVPFMLKCGHFFCRNCLLTVFSDDEGRIYCPEDQNEVANSISELKLLNNLINTDTENNEINGDVDNNNQTNKIINSFCIKHPNQRLTHIEEQSKEIMCVHCAFQKFRSNPQLEIKEITDVCGDLLEKVNSILEDNQYYVEILQSSLKNIKDNKANEENKVFELYDELIKFLEQKKEEYIDQINNVFSNNADKLSEKLDVFSQKMEEAEEFKLSVNQIMNNPDSFHQITDLTYHFDSFLKPSEDTLHKLELTEYNFISDNCSKIIKMLNSSAEFKNKTKIVKFLPKNHIEPEKVKLQGGTSNALGSQGKLNLEEELESRMQKINKISSINNNYSNQSHTKSKIDNLLSKSNTGNKTNYKNNNSSNYNNNLLNNNSNNITEENYPTNIYIDSSKKYSNNNNEAANYSYNNNKDNKTSLLDNSKFKEPNIITTTSKLDPNSVVKNNYELIKANNSSQILKNNNGKQNHYASVHSKNSYSKEILNTDELLNEHKESLGNKDSSLHKNSTNPRVLATSNSNYLYDPELNNKYSYYLLNDKNRLIQNEYSSKSSKNIYSNNNPNAYNITNSSKNDPSKVNSINLNNVNSTSSKGYGASYTPSTNSNLNNYMSNKGNNSSKYYSINRSNASNTNSNIDNYRNILRNR